MNNILLRQAQEIISMNNPKPYYNSAYRPAETYYWADIVDWLQETVSSVENPNVLDIGIAYGTLSTFCKVVNPTATLTAVDFAKYISDELIDKLDIDFRFCNFEKDDIHFDKKFDVIILTEVLEHFNFTPIPTMKKIEDLLSDNGSIFISTPNSARWGRLEEYESYKDMPTFYEDVKVRDQHVYQFSIKEVFDILDECGLVVVKQNAETCNNINIQVKKKDA